MFWKKPIEMAKNSVYAVFDRKTFLHLQFQRPTKPRIFLIYIPEYRNYGDIAIAQGARMLLGDSLIENTMKYEVIEVSNVFCRRWPDLLASAIREEDFLFIIGGGFLGSLWPVSHEPIERLLEQCPSNPVFLLPQTVFYYQGEVNKAKSLSKALHSREKLFVCAREANTLNLCERLLDLKPDQSCGLYPDCALYLKPESHVNHRYYAGVCLRKDHESRDEVNRKAVMRIMKSFTGLRVKSISTTGNLSIPIPSGRINRALAAKQKSFQQCDIVVTDRLHGMILSALCGSSCIAYDNVSKKVHGVYDAWLCDLPFVKVADSLDDLYISLIGVSQFSSVERISMLKDAMQGLRDNEFSELKMRIGDFLT